MEPFGGKPFIRGLPVVLKEADVREIFNEILAHTNKANRELLLQEEDIIKISCKKAVKANDKLSQQEIRGLLKDLEQKDSSYLSMEGP